MLVYIAGCRVIAGMANFRRFLIRGRGGWGGGGLPKNDEKFRSTFRYRPPAPQMAGLSGPNRGQASCFLKMMRLWAG